MGTATEESSVLSLIFFIDPFVQIPLLSVFLPALFEDHPFSEITTLRFKSLYIYDKPYSDTAISAQPSYTVIGIVNAQ